MQRLVIAVLAALQASVPVAPDLAGLDRGLEAVEAALRAREWDAAQDGLRSLLAEHEGREHVWLRRPRIVEAARLCAFLPSYRRAPPEELVHGELASYSPSTGQMELRYRNGELGDFLVYRATGEVEQGADRPLGERDFLLHPAQFQRGYSIRVRGARYGASGVPPGVLCLLAPGEALVVTFGLPGYGRQAVPAFIAGSDVLDQAESPALRGAPYALEVRVAESELLGLWDKTRVLSAKKDRKLFGQVGVSGVADWEEIEIAGVAQRSWMRGLQDDDFQHDLLAFAEGFDESKALPLWLHYERRERVDGFAASLPAGAPLQDAVHVRKLYHFLDEEDVPGGERFLAGLERPGVSEDLRVYTAGLWAFERGDSEAAARHVARLQELDPGFVNGQYLAAWVAGLHEGLEQGRARLGALARTHPEDPRFPGDDALFAFLMGERDEAEAILRRALQAHLYGAELDDVSAVLCKAQSGPSWLESFTHETEHFRIVTDIDARTCVEAGDVLETALGYFEKRIRPLAGSQAEPFRVYLFSGESGYQLYLANTTFFPAESTSGVFMPAMQQLLIWNTPDRGQMLSTVRHEGLHQYMHRLVRDQPTWLGEGLAEYWESADFTKGTSRENAPTEGKLSALRTYQAEFLPLERFLHLPRADFYREAGLHYTQAWAFVHFLLQDDRVSRALFDGLLDALIAGASSEQALERVFGPLDLPALERSFRAHLRKLL